MRNRDIEVGTRIKEARLNQKITQKQLADMIKVSQTAIALWENGSRSASLEAIDVLAEKLHVSAGYLLFGEKDIIDTSHVPNTKIASSSTLAAHFEGEEFTEEEIEEIKQFAEFVKSKRKDAE